MQLQTDSEYFIKAAECRTTIRFLTADSTWMELRQRIVFLQKVKNMLQSLCSDLYRIATG